MADLFDDLDDVLLGTDYKKTDDIEDDLDEDALLYGSDDDDNFKEDDLLCESPTTDFPSEANTAAVNAWEDNSTLLDESKTSLAEISDDKLQNDESLTAATREDGQESSNVEEVRVTFKRAVESPSDPLLPVDENVDEIKRRRKSSASDQIAPVDGEANDESYLEENGDHGEDEESDGDEDDNERGRFKSERYNKDVAKPVRSNMTDKREIPETLEISDEARQKIEDFDKQQREKKNKKFRRQGGRWNQNRGRPNTARGNQLPRYPTFQFNRPLLQPRGLTTIGTSISLSIPPPGGIITQPPLASSIIAPPGRPALPLGFPLVPPPWNPALRLIPPPSFSASMLGPPPAIPSVVQAPPITTATTSVIPVLQTTRQNAESDAGVGNPIPTLMTRNKDLDDVKVGGDSDDKKTREVVFGDDKKRAASPKLSVKITRSRSRSASPRPHSSHRRTVVRSRRSRSPRSRSKRRHQSKRRSRKRSHSLSPKRKTSSSPKRKSPEIKKAKPKIHINPHFKGPRSAVPTTSASSAATNPPAATAAPPPPVLFNPNVPPPPLLFPPRVPNPALPPPALPVPPPRVPITVPPPVLPTPPGVGPPVHVQPPVVSPPQVKVTPRTVPLRPNIPPPVVTPAPVRQQSILGAPPADKRLANPLGVRPNLAASLASPSAHLQPVINPHVNNLRATIRPSVNPNAAADKKSSILSRIGQKAGNPQASLTTSVSSRLKPPPSSVKDLTAQSTKVWSPEFGAEMEKYKALLEQQAVLRKQILAKKARRTAPSSDGNRSSPKPAVPTKVKVANLAVATKITSVERLMSSVSPAQDVTFDSSQRTVSGTFRSRELAQAFVEKYNRYMLDLSYITVQIVD